MLLLLSIQNGLSTGCFLFRLATTVQRPENGWGFILEECWGYIPCIELAVCLDRLELTKLAEKYNVLSGQF